MPTNIIPISIIPTVAVAGKEFDLAVGLASGGDDLSGGVDLTPPKTEISVSAWVNKCVLLQIPVLNEFSPCAYTMYFSSFLNSNPHILPSVAVDTTTFFSDTPFHVCSTSNFTLYAYPSRLMPRTFPEKTAVDFSNSSVGDPGGIQEHANTIGTFATVNKEKTMSVVRNTDTDFPMFMLGIVLIKKFSSPKIRNRQFVFAPKIEYKLVAERSEANQNSLTFPTWCLYCTKLEPIFKIGNVPRAERVVK